MEVDANVLGHIILDALREFEELTNLLVSSVEVFHETKTYFNEPGPPIETIQINATVSGVTETVAKEVKLFIRDNVA